MDVHLHNCESDEVENRQYDIERSSVERIGQERAEYSANAPPGQSHRMDARSASHSEPSCEKRGQHAEVSAIGGLAQKYADNTQYGASGDTEQRSEDSERAYEVI